MFYRSLGRWITIFVIRQKWHSPTLDKDGKYLTWREPSKTAQVKDFFTVVLRGGGGTPAMFALLGGQRYLVANILWNYADVLFHKAKIYEMVERLRIVRDLNPCIPRSLVNLWLASWPGICMMMRRRLPNRKNGWTNGEKVYIRAIEANPDKPHPYFDLSLAVPSAHRRLLQVPGPVAASRRKTGKINSNR